MKRLENAGVIAVLRADSKEEALKISHAVVEGRNDWIRIDFTVPQADEVIRSLVETYHDEKDIVIGAGTVLDAVTARLAIMAGAEFIVSPSFNRRQLKFVTCIKFLTCQDV